MRKSCWHFAFPPGFHLEMERWQLLLPAPPFTPGSELTLAERVQLMHQPFQGKKKKRKRKKIPSVNSRNTASRSRAQGGRGKRCQLRVWQSAPLGCKTRTVLPAHATEQPRSSFARRLLSAGSFPAERCPKSGVQHKGRGQGQGCSKAQVPSPLESFSSTATRGPTRGTRLQEPGANPKYPPLILFFIP